MRPNFPIVNLFMLTAFHKFALSRGQKHQWQFVKREGQVILNKLKCRRPDQSNPKIHFRLESLTVDPVLRYEATWFPHKCKINFVAVVLVENITLYFELASNIEIERFCSFSTIYFTHQKFALLGRNILYFIIFQKYCILKWEIPFYCASLEKGKRVTRTEEGENIILSQTALISLIY